MAERILVRKIEPGLWQWRFVTGQHQWLSESFYTGDINLLKESIDGKACWLVLDGCHVGTRQVDVGVKDRKLLPKLVPYELEESLVTPVDDLAFAYGSLEDGVVNTSYTALDYAEEAIAELEDMEADVQSLVCDYTELDAGEGWIILLDEGSVFVNQGQGKGFRCDAENGALFVKALFANDLSDEETLAESAPSVHKPSTLHIVADSEESLATLRRWLPTEIEADEEITIYEQEGGFWDVVSLAAKPRMDFRTGSLARKLPFTVWWNDWKIPAIAAGVAFVIALGTTWAELRDAKSDSRQLFTDRDAVYRQVVPTGSITDPVRQLKAKLNKSESTEPSNVVMLVSKIAPQIRGNGDLKITSFRYTHNNGTLQFNVEAKDFEVLEALRGKISDVGLSAEIKGSRASGDIQQAQIRVSES